MFKKTGDIVKQTSVHDPEAGKTTATCPKCGAAIPLEMKRVAYVAGEAKNTSCKSCGHQFEV